MTLVPVTGGVCAAQGFLTAGVSAGLKRSGAPDLALIVSIGPAEAAGVFTRNKVAAAPVRLSRKRVASGVARAVVVNSGCANACTGERGLADARAMARSAAAAVGVPEDQVLVCSTGLIGSFLDMEKVVGGIELAASSLSGDDEASARAIMTTDTVPKLAAVAHKEQGWHAGGIAKGAGMINPNMGTMLAFVTTDARVEASVLRPMLQRVADRTFNSITIDGDTSTNDTLLVLANGASGSAPDPVELESALTTVCESLSRQMVADGEGVTKFITVRVTGAREDADAVKAARSIAESTLVKTAAWGGDANWGRIASAVGNSGVDAAFDGLTITIAGVRVVSGGRAEDAGAIDAARKGMQSRELTIECDLGLGAGSGTILTTDLTPDYVRLNGEYEV